MFGYVNIYKDELKIKDYNIFRAYYCGLCSALGKHGTHLTRLGLSYDMTFLAIVLSAIQKDDATFSKKRCVIHPNTKRARVDDDAILEYTAHMSFMMAYLKCLDDWNDDHSIKAVFGMLAYSISNRKAKKKYPEEYAKIKKCLDKLSDLEKKKSAEIDEVSDCFAKLLELLFSPKIITDESSRRTLSWFGYNTGKWIYLIDAYADIESDLKSKSYNPILQRYPIGDMSVNDYKKTIKEDMSLLLTYTLDNIASSYELLTIYRNDEILKNIIYLGLKSKQDIILKEDIDESISSVRGI